LDEVIDDIVPSSDTSFIREIDDDERRWGAIGAKAFPYERDASRSIKEEIGLFIPYMIEI